MPIIALCFNQIFLYTKIFVFIKNFGIYTLTETFMNDLEISRWFFKK